MQKNTTNVDAGFTLLEVLIAMTLVATIVTALFGLFSNVIDATVHARTQMASDQAGRIILNVIEDDLRYMIVNSKYDNMKFNSSTDTASDEELLLGFASTSTLSFKEKSDHIGLQQIEYVLQSADEHNQLVRKERPYPSISNSFEWKEYVLADNVVSCSVEYYDPDYNAFQENWDSLKTTLPRALRFTMNLDYKGTIKTYSLVVPMQNLSE